MDSFHLEFSIPFLLLLTVVTFLYASAGHPGAGNYLALITLFYLLVIYMKQTSSS